MNRSFRVGETADSFAKSWEAAHPGCGELLPHRDVDNVIFLWNERCEGPPPPHAPAGRKIGPYGNLIHDEPQVPAYPIPAPFTPPGPGGNLVALAQAAAAAKASAAKAAQKPVVFQPPGFTLPPFQSPLPQPTTLPPVPVPMPSPGPVAQPTTLPPVLPVPMPGPGPVPNPVITTPGPVLVPVPGPSTAPSPTANPVQTPPPLLNADEQGIPDLGSPSPTSATSTSNLTLSSALELAAFLSPLWVPVLLFRKRARR